MFVYREEYQVCNEVQRIGAEEHFAWQPMMEARFGRAEVIIGKRRHRPTGTAMITFEANVTRFSDATD